MVSLVYGVKSEELEAVLLGNMSMREKGGKQHHSQVRGNYYEPTCCTKYPSERGSFRSDESWK